MKNLKYLSVFKKAKITLDAGDRICSLLSKSTLDRLTKKGFDRRLIKPVLESASVMSGGINDENVNSILNDINVIASMKKNYCKDN